jgi:hypothetical protein
MGGSGVWGSYAFGDMATATDADGTLYQTSRSGITASFRFSPSLEIRYRF